MTETTERRLFFGPIVWGAYGVGIDVQPSMRMWGVRFGSLFLGALYKSRPEHSGSKFTVSLKDTRHE